MSPELKPVVSSNIESAGYSADTETLVVQFKGGKKYKYPNVQRGLWEEFSATFDGTNGKSAGKFFHANIRSLPGEPVEE
jgi:hypothetical protein